MAMTYLTFQDDKSKKFWAVREFDDGKILAQYGKQNSKGIFATYKETKKLEKLVQSKIKKGYNIGENKSLKLFNMTQDEIKSKWEEINSKKKVKKENTTEKNKNNNNESDISTDNEQTLEMLQNLGPRTFLRDENKRNARFVNIAEEITPYYKYDGIIRADYEYVAYLLDLQKNELPLPVEKPTGRSRFERDKHDIAEKALQKRIQNYMEKNGDSINVGDIFFTGTFEDDRSDYPIHEYLQVLDENNQLISLQKSHSSNFQVNYSNIISEIKDFCDLEMVGWDCYYDNPEDEPFNKFINATN